MNIASREDLSWINKHYQEIAFKATSEKDFQIFIKVADKPAALGRIVHVDECNGELGGIYVLPEFRGRKLAEEIVQSLLGQNKYPVLWCIPFEPLESFYRKFGFREVRNENIPDEISGKVKWCEGRYPDRAILVVRTTS